MRPKDPIVVPEGWNARGEARIAGRPELLVFGGIPGERARVQILHRGRNRVLARWRSALPPDPHRVEPPCDRYHPCGGCPLMHLDAEGQSAARAALVRGAFEESGLAGGLRLDPMVPCPAGAESFRHIVKLVAGRSEIGRPRLGAPGRWRRRIVPIPDCLAVTPELRRLMRKAAWLFLEHDLRPWSGGEGLLRHVVARQSSATGEILVTLVTERFARVLVDYAEALASAVDEIVGIHVHVNSGPGNAIFAGDGQGLAGTRNLVGQETIPERLAGVEYRVGPGDFFQTNPSMADRIYRDVIEWSGAGEGVPLIDLYCGVGGLALALAGRTGWALGVERSEGAVRRARHSASAAGIPAEFLAGDVAEVLPDIRRRLAGRHPVVIVDPARRGLDASVLQGLAALEPARIVYMSCNPWALARDLSRLLERGYRLERLRPYDMFPHTSHVELVAVLAAPPGLDIVRSRRGPRRRLVRG